MAAVTAFAAAFLLSFALALAVETWPPSLAAFRAPTRALAIRALVHVAVYAAFFSLSWRPWHAALATVVVAGLLGVGSAVKRSILGEPLIVTDAWLVRFAMKHPRLYYAERLVRPPALAALAALAAATVAWFAVETPILPDGAGLLVLLPPAVAAAAVAALGSTPVAAMVRSLAADPVDPDGDVARNGLVATLATHAALRRRMERPSPRAKALAATLPTPRAAERAARTVVAIQCESFVDIASRGLDGPPLPAFERLRSEAIAWGRCRVPAEGAYTMRSEFGFLTGLSSNALGLDALDPFLVAPSYVPPTLAHRFAAAGRETVLVHPYDRRFFERDRLFPILGFSRFVAGEAFEGAPRFGRYVADEAVAAWIEREIAGTDRPQFLFVVTIENHGPWGPGRIPGVDAPEAQYAAHLANADRMIGRVASALRALPGGGTLCVYGDHAPGRTLHPGLPDRRATDYVLWDSRWAQSPRRREREDLEVAELGRALLAAG